MSLKYAILGFLSLKPFSGYDLWKMFDGSVNNYWHATHTQIYKTINDLSKNELVDTENILQTSLPNKKIYSLNTKGRDELINWLKSPIELQQIKDKFLVQLSFSNILSNEEIIINLLNYKNEIIIKLDQLNGKECSEFLNFARDKREKFLWKKTLENGIGSYKNQLEWIEKCILEFNEFCKE